MDELSRYPSGGSLSPGSSAPRRACRRAARVVVTGGGNLYMERPTDDLVQRILAAAADAGGRARSLVDAARADAEAEVKELLKTALKAALLRQALTELENTDV